MKENNQTLVNESDKLNRRKVFVRVIKLAFLFLILLLSIIYFILYVINAKDFFTINLDQNASDRKVLYLSEDGSLEGLSIKLTADSPSHLDNITDKWYNFDEIEKEADGSHNFEERYIAYSFYVINYSIEDTVNYYYEIDTLDAVKDADYPQYSEAFTQSFRDMVFSTFPNGREHRNLAKVKSSGYYNEFVYLNTTGNEPVIVTPVYKCDNPLKYGNEVYNSELYYYYFTQDEIEKATDVVKFIESLPKYKAINFNDCFGPAEDDEIYKHGSYALLYYGPGTPEIGTKGSFYFPANVKIGFMIRANTTAEGGKKQGEVYADGRLNNNINSYDKTNFKSSKLGTDGPRAAWFTLGDPDTNKNHLLLCWESGTDADFNDVIVEVEGGIDPFIIIYYDPYSYTYCFEDREIGDYDMNDVVLTVTRIDKTHVEYAVIACGANDELYIYNIDQGDIRHDKEVHAMFGKSTDTFINTTANDVTNTVSATIEVSENFNLLNPDIQPYIYNKTSNKYVRLSAQGEEPHAIIIPGSFQYPLEQVCIKDAYKDFVEWYKDQNTDKKAWYTRPTTGYVRTR